MWFYQQECWENGTFHFMGISRDSVSNPWRPHNVWAWYELIRGYPLGHSTTSNHFYNGESWKFIFGGSVTWGNGWISIKLHQSELNICQPPLVCPNRCECGSQYCHGLGAATLGSIFFDILTVLTCEKVKILWDIEKTMHISCLFHWFSHVFPASQK